MLKAFRKLLKLSSVSESSDSHDALSSILTENTSQDPVGSSGGNETRVETQAQEPILVEADETRQITTSIGVIEVKRGEEDITISFPYNDEDLARKYRWGLCQALPGNPYNEYDSRTKDGIMNVTMPVEYNELPKNVADFIKNIFDELSSRFKAEEDFQVQQQVIEEKKPVLAEENDKYKKIETKIGLVEAKMEDEKIIISFPYNDEVVAGHYKKALSHAFPSNPDNLCDSTTKDGIMTVSMPVKFDSLPENIAEFIKTIFDKLSMRSERFFERNQSRVNAQKIDHDVVNVVENDDRREQAADNEARDDGSKSINP